jgi:hypothetical protein
VNSVRHSEGATATEESPELRAYLCGVNIKGAFLMVVLLLPLGHQKCFLPAFP